jgi:hypothetical protein
VQTIQNGYVSPRGIFSRHNLKVSLALGSLLIKRFLNFWYLEANFEEGMRKFIRNE